MGVNIFAVSYEPTKYVELMILNDNDIEYISSNRVPKNAFLGLIDPYDNTFFNKRQMKKLIAELSAILSCEKASDNNEVFGKLKSLKEEIQLAGDVYAYLIFIGD